MAFGFTPPTRGPTFHVSLVVVGARHLKCVRRILLFLLNAGELSTPFQGSPGTWSVTHAKRVENYNLSVAH